MKVSLSTFYLLIALLIYFFVAQDFYRIGYWFPSSEDPDEIQYSWHATVDQRDILYYLLILSAALWLLYALTPLARKLAPWAAHLWWVPPLASLPIFYKVHAFLSARPENYWYVIADNNDALLTYVDHVGMFALLLIAVSIIILAVGSVIAVFSRRRSVSA